MTVLGIDGGGSKTVAAVAKDGKLVGRARAGTCKLSVAGREDAERELRSAIEAAMQSAGTKPTEIDAVCAGVAGVSDRVMQDFLRETLQRLVPGPAKIVGDHIIAYEAAFGDGPGILVIAGTGSIVRMRNRFSEWTRVGGWGPAISDQGSGFWIGRSAVAAVMQAYDAGQSTALLQRILDAWAVSSIDELVTMVNKPGIQFAQLFPVVLDAARSGDAIAKEVLTEAGSELARLADTALRRVPQESLPLPVAVAGGVFEHSDLVRKSFQASLLSMIPNVSLDLKPVDPVLGAIALASKMILDSVPSARNGKD